MAVDAARARRVDRPAWLNARTVLGAILFVTALLLGQHTMRTAATTTPMWAAAADIPVETTLRAEHLRLVEVRLPAEQTGAYAAAATDLVGATLTKPVGAGELIPLRWLSEGGISSGRVITIPLTAEHAAGGQLSPGDRVDVFATFDQPAQGPRTVLVAEGVEVVQVVSDAGLVMSNPAMAGVSVIVPPDTAADLAFAIRSAEIDVARVVGPGRASTRNVSLETLAR